MKYIWLQKEYKEKSVNIKKPMEIKRIKTGERHEPRTNSSKKRRIAATTLDYEM